MSPLAGIQSYISNTDFQFVRAVAPCGHHAVQGCSMAGSDTSGIPAAQQAAAAAAATVIVVGLDQTQEAEGLDRTSIALPGVQSQLVADVAAAAKACGAAAWSTVTTAGPGGRRRHFRRLRRSDGGQKQPQCACRVMVCGGDVWQVSAIVYACYPGQSGGQGIADVLFGTFNPGARLCSIAAAVTVCSGPSDADVVSKRLCEPVHV